MNVIIVLGLFAMLVSVEALHAQEGPRPARPGAQATTCNEFLPPPTRVADKRIGPEDCRIVSEETVFNLNGQRFRRWELRLSGTVAGWAARQGSRSNYFSDGPDSKQKGLASKHRMYEIAGVSHFDAGQVSLPHLVPQTLDLGGLVESLVDALDRWVEHGVEPPPTKSDVPELGGPALSLLEVACPLGVYYPYPSRPGDHVRGLRWDQPGAARCARRARRHEWKRCP